MKTLLLLVGGLLAVGFSPAKAGAAETSSKPPVMKLESPAFHDGQSIPAKHTCTGADFSPALKWSPPPAGAKSLALVCDDPDAPGGTWVHWVIYGVPATVTELPEHVATTETLSNGAVQGVNDFRRVGYGGPCPPPGKPHRYVFTVYALDTTISLPARATKAQLVAAMTGHILATGRLIGLFGR